MTDPTRTEDVEERVFPPITRGLVDCFYDRTESYTGCYDCGRQYGGAYGFPDLIVPDEVWKRISPTGDQGGLLCPSCIVKRCAQEGIRCEAEWKSGPFVPTHADARSEVSDHYDFYNEWDYEIRVTGPGVVVRGWDYELPKKAKYVEETRVDPREVEGDTMAERRWAMIRLGLARLNSRHLSDRHEEESDE